MNEPAARTAECALNEAAAVTGEVNKELDRLSEKLLVVSQRIAKYNIKITASVAINEDARLWFMRAHDRAWMLHISFGANAPVKVPHAPRELRVLAVDKIPDLIRELRAAAFKFRDDLSAADERLADILKELPE